jgi:short-subunit dehydrogenase
MKQTALITGASSGIGRAVAQEFASHGYDLVLVARTAAALEDVAHAVGQHRGADTPNPARVHVIAADLSRSGSARDLVDQLNREAIRVDVLVNNAGFGLQGEFADLPIEQQANMIQLNVVTLTELTRLLLPAMLTRQSGGVLNVASTAAFQAGPLMAVYYATKAYVLSLTEAIAEEVAGSGVKVTCLCPGPTATQFAQRAGMTDTNLFKGNNAMAVEQVAREAFDGWTNEKVVVIPGASNRFGAVVVRLAPRALVRRSVKRLNSRTAP